MVRNLLYVVFCLVVFTSCNNKMSTSNIDLLLCDGSPDGKLPDKARQVLLPFDGKAGEICLPQGKVFNASDSVSYIKPKNWLEKVRGNITKNNSILILTEKIDNYLQALNIEKIKPNSPVSSNYLTASAAQYDVTLGYDVKDDAANKLKFKCFKDPKELVAYIRDSVNITNPDARILVFYGSPAMPAVAETPDPVKDDTIMSGTPAPVPVSDPGSNKVVVSHRTAPDHSKSPDPVIQKYFDDLSTPTVNYSKKDGLIKQWATYLANPNVKVTIIGENNTTVADLTAHVFLETLRTSNDYYLFVSGTKDNNNTYSEIKVKAD